MIDIENAGKVTVIVPLYKSEDFVRKCVDSILDQTYHDIELILVDDGSPDNSGSIADEYSRKDDRVVVIHEENGGTCAARNAGLGRASGKYLMFADGDDWLAPDCIEYLLKLLKETKSEMSMTDCVFTTRNMQQDKDDWIKKLSPEEVTCEILYVKTPVGPWNKLYTTEVIKKNNLTFSVPWFGEGLWFSAMAAQLSNSVGYGHKKVYIYRKNNPNSGTTVRNVQHGLNSLRNIEYIKKQLIVRTPATENAANWHIWKNNFNLLVFIIGAHAEREYSEEYHRALHNVKTMMPYVLKHSDVSAEKRIEIIGLSAMPRTAARCAISLKKIMFKKDIKREMQVNCEKVGGDSAKVIFTASVLIFTSKPPIVTWRLVA